LSRTRLLSALLLLSLVSTPAARAQLQVLPPSIDFGERGQNERPEATLTLRNTGSRPLLVREIKKSCDCLGFFPPQLNGPIPPGGTSQIKVSMGSGRAMGLLEKRITIVTQNLEQPELVIPVAMRVFDAFEMEPRSVSLEGVCGGAPAQAAVEIKLRPGRRPQPVRLEVKTVRSVFTRPSGQYLRATIESIPGGQRIKLELDPRHPEGPISAEVEALLEGKPLFVPVNGEMFAWIKVSPNYINFSRATEEDPASTVREVVLTATDSTPFRVLDVSARPYRPGEEAAKIEFSVEAAPRAPAGAPSTVQKVTCRVLRAQGKETSFFGTVTIRTDHPRKPEFTLKYSGFFPAAKPKG
jgi:hypothetical protein